MLACAYFFKSHRPHTFFFCLLTYPRILGAVALRYLLADLHLIRERQGKENRHGSGIDRRTNRHTTHGYGDKVSCNYGYPNMLDTSVQRLIGSYECILNSRFAIALFFLSALVILMLERKILRYFITQRG